MDLKQIAKDTAKVLVSYLTYQAVRVVVAQLRETNPVLAIWLNGFSSTGKIQDGEAYLQELLQENQELALRIMTVREHLGHRGDVLLARDGCYCDRTGQYGTSPSASGTHYATAYARPSDW